MNQEVKLSPLEIEALRTSWMPGNTSLFDTCGIGNRSDIREYLKQLKEYEVIEIGPGGHPVNLILDCKKYVGVQPHKCFVPNIGGKDYVLEDGLSFLRKQSDSSAVVVSFGVMDEDVLGYGNIRGLNKNQTRYMQEFAKEIKRVSSPFAIIVGCEARKYLGKGDLLDFDFMEMGGVYSFDK